jgi:hypothetical protein
MIFLLLLVASLGGASWSLICLIVSLILLFIAAFITGGGAWFSGSPSWPARGIAFGWAGIFFYVLAVAIG